MSREEFILSCPNCHHNQTDCNQNESDLVSKEIDNAPSNKSIAYKRCLRSLTFITIGLVILSISYIFLYLFTSSPEISFIKKQVIESYEDYTLGVALDEFFYHPTWDLTKENTVEFNGEAYWGEEESLFTIQFKVDVASEQFDITSYSINGEPQTFNQFIQLLDTIYEK